MVLRSRLLYWSSSHKWQTALQHFEYNHICYSFTVWRFVTIFFFFSYAFFFYTKSTELCNRERTKQPNINSHFLCVLIKWVVQKIWMLYAYECWSNLKTVAVFMNWILHYSWFCFVLLDFICGTRCIYEKNWCLFFICLWFRII